MSSIIARSFEAKQCEKAPWMSWPTELSITGFGDGKSDEKASKFFAFALDLSMVQQYDSRLSLKATQKCKLFDNRSG